MNEERSEEVSETEASELATDAQRVDAARRVAILGALQSAIIFDEMVREVLEGTTDATVRERIERLALAFATAPEGGRVGKGFAGALADRWVDNAMGPSQEIWRDVLAQAQRNADRYRIALQNVRGEIGALATRLAMLHDADVPAAVELLEESIERLRTLATDRDEVHLAQSEGEENAAGR